ncbi:polysaccharide deacetylase family protein [bacterium]|nr:polysaccharide deacetylase family protein [bacterium]
MKKINPDHRGSLNPVLHSPSSRKIALTFDACSTLLPSRVDSTVIEILIRTGAPATLFLGGKWVQDRPDDARFLATIPFFEIGNHSYLHGHLTRVSDERLQDEIRWTQEIIYTVTGVVPKFFRPPYIEYDDRVIQTAAALGLTTIVGDIPSGDPDPHATKERLITQILNGVKSGTIVIMHMNKGGKHTAEALPETIRLLRENGYELVTMSGLLENQDQVLGGNTIGGSLGNIK